MIVRTVKKNNWFYANIKVQEYHNTMYWYEKTGSPMSHWQAVDDSNKSKHPVLNFI